MKSRPLYSAAAVTRRLALLLSVLLSLAVLTGSMVAATPASAAPLSAAQSQQTYFAANCITPSYQPVTIVVSCADAGFQVSGLAWAQWTTRLANGSGVARVNNCVPNCAFGTFHAYPVLVTLSQPRFCRNTGYVQFQRMTLFFSAQRPPTLPGRTTFTPGCGLDQD